MLTAGTRLGGHLEVLGPLGAGGMGEVYRARDTVLGREVAVKVLPTGFAEDADRMARFDREARAASSLNHPNIVTLHGVGRDGATGYQVLELVQGQTLREALSKRPLPLQTLLRIGEQIASGLAAAHAAGIVHRDLKPENIMVREDGVVKILDFGLARQHSAGGAASRLPTVSVLTSPGAIVGTIAYMSPEQARGEPADFRSDQFALGTILYEMAAGRRPFAGGSEAQTLAVIIEREPEPVARARADAPPPLSWIVERCLAKDPGERYASTLDLARDLRNLRDRLSEISSRPALREDRPPAPRRAGPVLWAALALVVGVPAGMALRSGFSPGPGEPPKLHAITFTGQDNHPAVSAGGRLLAFASLRDGMSRIWLKSLVEGTEAPLTSGPDTRPRISPDGTTILFVRDEGAESALYRVPVLGGEPRKLVPDAFDGDWSPGGDRVVFLRLQGGDGTTSVRVGIAGVAGGGETAVGTIEGTMARSPRWSPDGAWIAITVAPFGSTGAPARYVQLLRADGSGTRLLRSPVEGGDVSGVAWSGGGQDVWYGQGESVSSSAFLGAIVKASASRILRHSLATGKASVALWVPTLIQAMDIAGPGHLVFDALSVRQSLQEFDISRSPARPGALLSQGASIDRQPIYSPDGQWVVFSSNRSGNLDVWARSLWTGELRRLTDHSADDWDPAFTLDGRRLVFTSHRGGNFEIWTADANGAGARQVSNDGFDAENAVPTPDGQWVVYNSAHPEKKGLWKIRIDGTQERRLVAGTCAWPEVSPDGRHVAYTVGVSSAITEIRVARVEDGGPVSFTIRVESSQIPNGRCRWMPGGDAIAFSWRHPRKPGIYVQDFRPGEDTSASRRALVELEPGAIPESFGIAPDGQRLTLASGYPSFSLMSAENLAGLEPPRRRAR
jgi:Tol biopolymer transport system component